MRKKRVTLTSFLSSIRADIGAFETMWMAEREKNKADWPLAQSTMEDWRDQFIAWMECRADEANEAPAPVESP